MRIKNKLVVCIIAISVLLGGCDWNNSVVEKISMDQALNMIYNQDTFILTITADDCDSCDKFADIQKDTLADNHAMSYQINYDELNDNELVAFNKYIGVVKKFPTTYYLTNGKVMSAYEFNGSKKEWVIWLQEVEKMSQN